MNEIDLSRIKEEYEFLLKNNSPEVIVSFLENKLKAIDTRIDSLNVIVDVLTEIKAKVQKSFKIDLPKSDIFKGEKKEEDLSNVDFNQVEIYNKEINKFPPPDLVDQALNKSIIEKLSKTTWDNALIQYFRVITHPFRKEPIISDYIFIDNIKQEFGLNEKEIIYLLSGTNAKYPPSEETLKKMKEIDEDYETVAYVDSIIQSNHYFQDWITFKVSEKSISLKVKPKLALITDTVESGMKKLEFQGWFLNPRSKKQMQKIALKSKEKK